MTTRKEAYIADAMLKSKTITEVKNFVRTLEKQYFDNTYNSGGADEILNADLTAYDITATQFGDYMNVVTELKKLFFNEAVTQGDYAKSLNVIEHASL